MNRTQLVLELFAPDELGISRWVSKDELVGKYSSLYTTNGNQWMRNRGLKHLKLEKEIFNRVTHWRFNGFEENPKPNRPIKKEIRDQLLKNPCAATGFNGTKYNPIVVDHKNGRYNDNDVLNLNTQKVGDFQALCNQANITKGQYCSTICKKTNKRFDAKTLGYSVSFIKGDENYRGECDGCYWYDPIKFKQIVSQNNTMEKLTDEYLLEIYTTGFEDELGGRLKPPYNNQILIRIYNMGRRDAVIGDDIIPFDNQTTEKIMRQIKNIEI
jgi:hypothetical protein